jgi:serine/threonine protein phosphatase PrpC
MQIRPGIDIANLTDPGCVRTVNEDYYCFTEPESDEQFHRRGRLLVVADGMGGHVGGQVASGIAVDSLREVFLNSAADDPTDLLVEGFSRAQRSILDKAAQSPELKGMGTTCTAAIIHHGHLIYGHIGDSRLYLIRHGQPSQVTEDHSLVNRLLKSGTITPEQAAVHQDRNVLTAALGMPSDEMAAEFSEKPIPLEAGDGLVLASDGLHGLVNPDEIREAVEKESPYQACRTMVELAKRRGGPDNITVQILRILPEFFNGASR